MPSSALRDAACAWGVSVIEDGMERNSTLIAHDILDALIEKHPELCIERLGDAWIGYAWIGPAGEDTNAIRGTFEHVVAEMGKRAAQASV